MILHDDKFISFHHISLIVTKHNCYNRFGDQILLIYDSGIRDKFEGALDGDPLCGILILTNGNVACPCCLFYPMSHVEFKNRLCHMSL